jgi:NADPH:quinone reductase-like Zn-dependent oxidoreductase
VTPDPPVPAGSTPYAAGMKAAVRTRYGPPEVVGVAEVERPAAGDREVLVRVHATTVNRTDCAMRAADPFLWRLFTGLVRPRVRVLGTEFAGEVVAVGSAVTAFAAGDRVFGFDDGGLRAHAQYLSIAQDATIATIPADLAYEDVAPGTEGAHYALSMIRVAGVSSGQDVLVNGATGAIGSAAVQLLASLGAHVTAVCDTPNVALVRRLGAMRVIDRNVEDFTSDRRRYDAVLDAVGKSTFRRCRRLLKPRGTYVSSDVGPAWQNVPLALVTPLLRGRRVRFPVPRHDAETLAHLRALIEAREFRPVVDRRYPLDDIVEAYRYVETGQKVGNVVIAVEHDDPGTVENAGGSDR